jgi:hypothetical protein
MRRKRVFRDLAEILKDVRSWPGAQPIYSPPVHVVLVVLFGALSRGLFRFGLTRPPAAPPGHMYR